MCKPKPSRGPSLRAVLVALAAVVVVPVAVNVALNAAEAFALTVFAVCVAGVAVLVRLLVPARRTVRSHYGERITARALPAPPLELEAVPALEGVIISSKEAVR